MDFRSAFARALSGTTRVLADEDSAFFTRAPQPQQEPEAAPQPAAPVFGPKEQGAEYQRMLREQMGTIARCAAPPRRVLPPGAPPRGAPAASCPAPAAALPAAATNGSLDDTDSLKRELDKIGKEVKDLEGGASDLLSDIGSARSSTMNAIADIQRMLEMMQSGKLPGPTVARVDNAN
ncbi:conserved hypothetical pox protein truncated PPV [Squirrelpox virus]|uniref:Conserved hypothetical pox protein truncated PPV n=1 Tax=Squirrelpox virus TaxID=240426 RepID=U3UBL3_9POXV|nr:conserved hypothetical pox protein truncated PPV [Squirrelpox virus]CCD83275.1 conserved hypothetical pox protein truncated PPV [Squirrelpox virus]